MCQFRTTHDIDKQAIKLKPHTDTHIIQKHSVETLDIARFKLGIKVFFRKISSILTIIRREIVERV